MADLVDVVIQDRRWEGIGLDILAQSACRSCLNHLNFDPEVFEISLLGCDDARISALNADFRAKPTPTNVLSWPAQERAPVSPGLVPVPPKIADGETYELGDIAIAYETCVKEARVAAKPQDQHVFHLLVHATLHLLGYDHILNQDAVLMEETERKVLATVGHPDPYEEH